MDNNYRRQRSELPNRPASRRDDDISNSQDQQLTSAVRELVNALPDKNETPKKARRSKLKSKPSSGCIDKNRSSLGSDQSNRSNNPTGNFNIQPF